MNKIAEGKPMVDIGALPVGENSRELIDAMVGLLNGTVSPKEANAIVRRAKAARRRARQEDPLAKAIATSDATVRRMQGRLKVVKAMIECKKKGSAA